MGGAAETMPNAARRGLPSVDRVLAESAVSEWRQRHGHVLAVRAVREALAEARATGEAVSPETLAAAALERGEALVAPSLRRVFNLTGTVLHTNLGRAPLCEAAVAQAAMAMREACNLEFDLDGRGRGERDRLVEGLLCELTGAEAATVVNNNAAAVLLMLAGLAAKREVIVSRGELVEIGGAFRIPDVMRMAQVRLVEVGTTNRTHARDFAEAVGPKTAALMKVHASNYAITGFVAAVPEAELATIARGAGVPLIVDLGAGSLVDLSAHGLPKEPVVGETIAAGADLVSFSGDKLLGGPQAGLIVGRGDLIARIRRHPLKRALRASKITLAALEATLIAYRRSDRLAQDLPTLRLLTRPLEQIAALAARLAPPLAAALGADWRVETAAVKSQVGSGALPVETLPSLALAVSPTRGSSGRVLADLAGRFAALPTPVVGRIADGRLLLDLRCLEDEAGFLDQLSLLGPTG
jgi:L-seryl-tRNA(Ser) seleniumtransferase